VVLAIAQQGYPWRRPYPRPVSAGQYFTEEPAVGSSRRTLMLNLPDLAVPLMADRGVFASDRVDPGTHYLLQEVPPPPPTGDVLDLGCGYGPIALTLARRAPGATVWAVDVNERALALCAENAAAVGLRNVRCVAPDSVPDHVAFATIWSNPPIRIGKAPLHALLLRWLSRLEEGATAHLVVQKHLGADSLAAWLSANGLPTIRRGSRQAYRLLDVTCASSTAPA
jgi:16S rRNA (guanine1207-N2)-methyltransferase